MTDSEETLMMARWPRVYVVVSSVWVAPVIVAVAGVGVGVADD